ncbi:MAG TPA: alpha-2-macroglobulin family protein, partial [Bacteroidetes bacterium]|nr:alpha-2-macroglobulin family protein [Bacteroidota bacterium]
DTVYLQGKPHTFRMRIRDAGNYAILVHPLDEPNYIKHVNFSAYGKEVATASSFGVDHEGQIAIALDKEKYLTGQKARLLFTTPFSGRMLVTVEREKVYQHYYLDVTNNSAELVLPIREEFAPNVVVTATLFRPQRNRRAMILTVAHGHAQLKVDNARLRLPVEIQAPERIKPGGTTYVTVKTVPQKNVFVTLAVVDEGILALKGFQTPDPFGYMYSARASEVRSFDMYKYLLPEVPSAQAATGGGVGGGSSHLLNPIQAQRFKPVAIWSGILPTNAAGKVRIPVTIPKEFNGKVRLMAVAHAGKRFGAGEAWLTIRDDVVMLPGLPRFATAGDTFTVPVTLLNTTDREGSAEVHLHLEGPLELLGSATQRVALTAKGSALLNFQVRAMDAIGVGKIQLDLSDMETRRQDFELAIRPPAPYENEGGSGSVAAGNTVSLQIPGGFYPDLHQTKIRISRFPALKMGKHLEYLLRYPHGCAEQTTSAVFPQLYFPELAELVAPDLYTSSNAVFHIREAIRKLESMQLYQGNFSYWPGGSYSNEWASIYVTHFLIEASRAGYSVNKTTLENAIAYLREHISEKSTFTYTFYRNHRPFTQTKATKEAIYGIYVLALSGSPDLPIMNYYRSHLKLLSGDSRYLLAAAFALTGDMQGFEALLPAKMEAEETDRLTGGNFDSGIRSN